jgi:hypothetical protein
MAGRKPEQSQGSAFLSVAGENRSLKKGSSLAIILVLYGGWFVSPTCCARESSRVCCSSHWATVSRAPAASLVALEGRGCSTQAHQGQTSVPGENLSKTAERPPCCSGEAQTTSRAVLTRFVTNPPIAANITGQAALSETGERRCPLNQFAPVMNRGSTYLLCCVLRI